MKKHFGVIIPLAVLMSMVGVKTYAHDIEVENSDGTTIYYNFINNNTELCVTYKGYFTSNSDYSGNIVIPENVYYGGTTYSVTQINVNAFQNCFDITSVTIPKSFPSVDNRVFIWATKMTSVTYHCKTIICSSWPTSSPIKEVVLGDEVTTIGPYAFKNFKNLSSIIIPNKVTEIDKTAFDGCSALINLTIHSTTVGAWFTGNTTIINVFLGSEVRAIDNNAFQGCSGLSTINIPSNVISIGSNAFQGCVNLLNIEIPSSVTNIGTDAFADCENLNKVIVRDLGAWCKIDFGNAKANPLALSRHLYQSEDTEIIELTIPEGIDNIGKYSFYNATNLNSCVIPNNIKEVSVSAFEGCTNLVTLSLADGIAKISDKAFNGCEKIQILEIPNSVTSIGTSAFGGSRINSLYIGTGVSSIGTGAFGSIRPTKTIWFTNTPPNGYTYAAGEVNYVLNEQYKSLSNQTVYPYLNSYFITDGVKYVPVSPSERTCDIIDGCYDNTAENIIISPEVLFKNVSMSVKTLAQYAFYNNQSIKKVNMKFDGNIGNRAFSECANLQEINIEISGTIDTYAFCNCTGLKDVTISKSKEINYCSFYQSGIQGVLKITNTGEIGSSAFSEIVGEFKANIANNKKIGTNAFSNCKGLQEVVLGDEITELEDKVFYGCTDIDSITIGAQIKKIGKEAFYDCKKISKIISRATTPPVCNTNALDNINKWNCKLYVPKGCLSSYQAADQWKDFFFISEGNFDGDTPDNPDNKKCAKPTISYVNGKLTFASSTEGATCYYSITDTDIKDGSGNEVQLGVTYNINVYATKEGYENSETANATLCWIDQQPKVEGDINGIANITAKALLIKNNGGQLTVEGAADGETISVYTVNGMQSGSAISQNGAAHIDTKLQAGSIAIVKIGNKSVKIVIK